MVGVVTRWLCGGCEADNGRDSCEMAARLDKQHQVEARRKCSEDAAIRQLRRRMYALAKGSLELLLEVWRSSKQKQLLSGPHCIGGILWRHRYRGGYGGTAVVADYLTNSCLVAGSTSSTCLCLSRPIRSILKAVSRISSNLQTDLRW